MQNELHQYSFVVLETYLDRNDHLNHAMYLRLFEEARWDMVTAKGYGMRRIQETGLGPIILSVTIDFRKELRLRQKICIETQVTGLKKKLATLEQKMKNELGQVCCTATFTFGLFDLQARKLANPTPEWLKAIGFIASTP